jgi:TonB family protein
MPPLSSRVTSSFFLAGFLFAAALCLCSERARGQVPAKPQTPPTSPAEMPPQTASSAQDQNSDMNSVPAPPEFHALVADFRAQLQKAGIRKVLLRDFESSRAGHYPLEDWMGDRVAEDLTSPPDGLTVFRMSQLQSTPNGPGLRIKDADAQIFAWVEPMGSGIKVKLSAFRGAGPSYESAGRPFALTEGDLSLTGAIAPWVPEIWGWVRPNPQDHPGAEGTTSVFGCGGSQDPKPQSGLLQSSVPVKIQLPVKVQLSVIVGADGEPYDIQVVSSAGKEIDGLAIEKVKCWKFKPALDANGNPAATRVVLEVEFKTL